MIERLAEFRRLAAGRAFKLGSWDCGMLCAEWVRLVRGVDPAAAWRGRYSTAAELDRILDSRGGIVETVEKRGDLWVVELPEAALGFFERYGQMPLPPYIRREPDATDMWLRSAA